MPIIVNLYRKNKVFVNKLYVIKTHCEQNLLIMARTIRNAGSAPIYRETENLMLLCIEMVERTPNSVGIRQLSKRLIDTLLDGLTVIGLALNEEDPDSKLELINSFYLQMRTVKTCIDTLKEWSNGVPIHA